MRSGSCSTITQIVRRPSCWVVNTAPTPTVPERTGYWGFQPSVLITQRSRVQIPPPLPVSAGQRPDRRKAVRLLDRLSAVRPRDLASEHGTSRPGPTSIGITAREFGAALWGSQVLVQDAADSLGNTIA